MTAETFGSQSTKPAALLSAATALAALSFFWHTLPWTKSLDVEIVLGYVPLVSGVVCVWLCLKARSRTKHKGLVLCYSVHLAPFAFSYPAWMLIVWIAFESGHYNGPMP